MSKKGVIEKTGEDPQQFVSNIFPRPKKDGGCRIILDLTLLNTFVQYKHFKMDTFYTAMQLVSTGCYMATIDLKDAYYSVPIHHSFRRYLKFKWMGQLWQYKALPNGLSSAPRLFTKLLKPALALLRAQKHIVMAYLDDILIVNANQESAEKSVSATTSLFEKLGFLIHPTKSKLQPSQTIEYLGFVINSVTMLVTLPMDKVLDLTNVCQNLINKPYPSIREVAKVIGKLVAAFPAVEFGRLHYQNLQRAKTQALIQRAGHFDRPMQLPKEALSELHWWIENVPQAAKNILVHQPVVFYKLTQVLSDGGLRIMRPAVEADGLSKRIYCSKHMVLIIWSYWEHFMD